MSGAADSAIRIRGLTVVRGVAEVLHGVDLDVAGGQITGLLGPSGCGKTTLMRAIMGVQIIEEGDVTVLGRPAGSPPLRSQVGYVTQAPSVYADLTVRENLRYFASVLGTTPERIDTVIETVGLGAFAARIVAQLSGGQQARVGLATALLNKPPLLVSSHVMDEADRCDRLLLMRGGRILAAGTPAELREDTGADDLDAAFLRLVERGQVTA